LLAQALADAMATEVHPRRTPALVAVRHNPATLRCTPIPHCAPAVGPDPPRVCF
jgi:hypothetical protein